MSIWSCARHNGMTGAGSDRDVGPTPVQRARFQDISSWKRQSVRIYWRRLERTRCTRAGSEERSECTKGDECLPDLHAPLPPSTVSHHTPAKSLGCSMSSPVWVRQKTDHAGMSGMGFGARTVLQQACSRCITLQRMKG